jgi:hypothetical protein
MVDNRTYDDKPLWDLMEEAAATLETASQRYHDAGGTETGRMGQKLDEIDWRPANLRYVAKQWREEAEATDKIRQGLITTLRVHGVNGADLEGAVDEIMGRFEVTPRFTVTVVEPDSDFPMVQSKKLADYADQPNLR